VMCASARECIACSRIVPSYNDDYRKSALDLRKWWAERVKRLRAPENEWMRRGKEIHEQLCREQGVTEDLREVFNALGVVGRTVLWSARLCSRADGIRGQPDWVESTRVAPDRIYHLVVEAKSHPHPHKKYFPQAVSYSLMMSNPRVIANGLYFYDHIPTDRNFNVDVDVELYFYHTGRRKHYDFVRDWSFITSDGNGRQGAEYVFGVKRLIKKFSGITRIKDIRDIPPCGYCLPLASRQSAVNGGPENPEKLCHVWPLCREDLLAETTEQKRLGRWVRRRPEPRAECHDSQNGGASA